MEIRDKTIVITGGASGIGEALARRVAQMGARVCIADVDVRNAERIANDIGAMTMACDVTEEEQIKMVIAAVEASFGQVDIFVSNAGLAKGQPNHAGSASDATWTQSWHVHVMAHVWASRALLPGMISRGSGYLVNVASAAGLLNQIGDAAYSATKHAAVSFAESLAISHGHQGIGVSVVCPQYVATPLLGLSDADADGSLLTAGQVAEQIVIGVEADQFLILPHACVHEYALKRARDHGRWIMGMQKMRAKAEKQFGKASVPDLYKLL